jgi:hypothetical protein
MRDFPKRLLKCVKDALPKAGKISLWLLKIILPVSLFVRFLQYSGALSYFAEFLNPLFNLIGLPGETAIVFLTSIFLPLYASIAVMTSLIITLREATILTLMCLLSHNLLVESAVQKKTGSSFWWMTTLRILMSIVVAFVLNKIMPASTVHFEVVTQPEVFSSVGEVFSAWFNTSVTLIITILLIVSVLMILQKLLEEYKLFDTISRPLRPFMKFFGMPEKASFLWIVGNVVGLAYGGAIMIEQIDNGMLSRNDVNVLNHHLAISHSLLEDTLLFVALGISFWWIVLTRMGFAFVVVWCFRLKNYVFINKLHSNAV